MTDDAFSEKQVSSVGVTKIWKGRRQQRTDLVATEALFTIQVNGAALVSLMCTPRDLESLAVGFLLSERLLSNTQEIKNILVRQEQGTINVETTTPVKAPEAARRIGTIVSGCGGGTVSSEEAFGLFKAWRTSSKLSVPASSIFELMRSFQEASELFRSTGGVHSAALCEEQDIVVIKDDIGRHNAVDKVFGECLLKGIPTRDKILLTTGRVSSDILVKAALREVPIVVSRSAPTHLAVGLADAAQLTLAGFVRDKRMNIYTNDWRIS